MNNPISICIPCYEMRGNGVQFLFRLLNSIAQQEYKSFEVVISDHSISQDIELSLEQFKTRFPITYIKNEYKRGNSSANTNVAISNAKYDLIKIMFQDDFFINPKAFTQIAQCDFAWGAASFIHTDEQVSKFFRPFLPRFHDKIALGDNTMGCPSILHFYKDVDTLFDENTIWLMDCDFYQKLYTKYGPPEIINEMLLAVRLWGESVSGFITEETKQKELMYIKGKYGI